MKTAPTLDKTAVGEFFGKISAKYNMDVLDVYLNEYDFKGIFFVNGLKMMLSGFRLIGEGQIVDKMMEKFGEKFAADNPNGGPNKLNREMSAEALYLVSYATMMLQTSLHNPNAVKSRMTIIDFTKQLKGVNGGKSLDDEFL